MQLKNYQEDLVLHVIQIALEDRPEIQANEAFIHDVASYTLNRIPPRYIQGERGFTRLVTDHILDGEPGGSDGDSGGQLARMVQILLLVNRAIDIVQNRRETSALKVPGNGISCQPLRQEADNGALGYWHNLPYLIGRVVDDGTGKPLFGVSVTAYLDGQKALPAEPGWQNPCYTVAATRGYYSFLPRSIRCRGEKRQFRLHITFERAGYRPFVLDRKICTQGGFEVRTAIASDDIMNLTTARLLPAG